MPDIDLDSSPGFFRSLSPAVTGAASDEQGSYANLFTHLCDFHAIPEFKRITAIRHISGEGANGSEHTKITGTGLNGSLSELENPELEDRALATKQWTAFIAFVREVLNDPAADVDISSKTHGISVSTGGTDYLPLSSLGTGIEELIILAAEVACTNDSLICIEEPEIHLHPTLQARFMRYLMEEQGGNRFLVTTHSATVINTPDVTLTHVWKRDRVCYARSVNCGTDVRGLLDDIGARPSDLLQTDFVVWVEGPSDRIYVRSWLSRIDSELVEGVHYSVMFYGGKLLNSLGADCDAATDRRRAWAEAEDDLISLFRINTHFCVLMDSDCERKGQRINKTKRRIVRECGESGAMSWVTEGRTIENYVPESELKAALAARYPKKQVPADHKLGDMYTCPLSFSFKGYKAGPKKIDVAHWLEGRSYDLDKDLTKHLEELSRQIRDANGMPPLDF